MLRRAFFVITIALCLPVQGAGLEAPQVMTYRKIEGHELKAHVFVPTGKPSGAAILLFHGGGWSMGAPEWTYPAARRFAALGLTAVAVEYRLTDEKLTPADALDDTCAAFAWIRQNAKKFGIDVHRVAGYGVSAGGQLVAGAATIGCREVGVAGRPNALLLWSAAIDLSRDHWFERQFHGKATSLEYSPAQHVGPTTPPTSIVHGEKDTLTPLTGAKTFCQQLRGFGVRCDLHVYPGVGHLLTRNLADQEDNFDPDPADTADGIAQFDTFLAELGYTSVASKEPPASARPHPGS